MATDVQVFHAFRYRCRLEILSDGSLKHQSLGTSGWKIITNKDVLLYNVTGSRDGPPEMASSTTCSELGGAMRLPYFSLLP